MKVIGLRTEEGEGEGTHIVAFVNALIDVFEEVLDSLHKLGRPVCVSAFTALSQRKRTGQWLAMSEDPEGENQFLEFFSFLTAPPALINTGLL